MSYREKNVVAKFTKDNYFSDCGDYHVKDLLDMFDETHVSNEYDLEKFTVNQCVSNGTTDINLVVVEEGDDDGLYCYMNKDTVLQNEADKYFVEAKYNLVDEVECSKELDYEFKYQSE